MNMANMSNKERMEYLQRKAEMYDTFQYYRAKVCSWMEKKVQSKVILEDNITSHYHHSKKEVHIAKGSEKRVYGHEFGHEFYARFIHDKEIFILDVSEMFDWYIEFLDEDEHLVADLLSSFGNRNEIRIFTDFLACNGINIRSMGFIGHKKDYGETQDFDIADNEAFAEFFAALYSNDWECFSFMIKTFPKFCNSCFMAIEKGVSITA